MTKNKSSVRVYILEGNDFLLSDIRGRVINRHSPTFEREDKTAKYDSKASLLIISSTNNGYKNPLKQKKEIKVINNFEISKDEYLVILNNRLSAVRTCWEKERELESILRPYLGGEIPKFVLGKRDQQRESIPQPLSLLSTLLAYKNKID